MTSDKKRLAILSDMLYVPSSEVRNEHLTAYTYKFEKVTYEKPTDVTRKCANCELWKKPWRNAEGIEMYCHKLGYTETDYCNRFNPKQIRKVEEYEVTTYKEVANEYYAFGRGDLGKIEEVFSDFQVVDQRSAPKLGIPLKLKEGRVLRPDQVAVVEEWLKHGYGILKAPTAFGKTVVWSYLVQHLGLKTILLAQEVRHLAVGWEGLYEHTNLEELEEEAGQILWGRVGHDTHKVVTQARDSNGKLVDKIEFKFKKSKDPTKTHPITFATYQSLNSAKGKLALDQIKDSFGLLWLEECHHEAAETFHHVTKSFNSYYRGGQSATPTRKDQMTCATYDTIGPVTAVATKEQMNCDFTFINTGVYLPDKLFNGMYPLNNVFNFLATSTDVQNCLLQWMIYDIQSGRKPLYITERKADAFSLKSKIHLSGYNVELIMGGQKMQKQQKEYSQELSNGSLHCIIGTKVIKENYNIPPLDTLYLLYPNFVVESEEQMTGRIRRYVLDAAGNQVFKNKPLIRIFTVNSNQEVMKKSINFRKNFYYKMSFEEIRVDATEHETEKPDDRVSSKLKDW